MNITKRGADTENNKARVRARCYNNPARTIQQLTAERAEYYWRYLPGREQIEFTLSMALVVLYNWMDRNRKATIYILTTLIVTLLLIERTIKQHELSLLVGIVIGAVTATVLVLFLLHRFFDK